MAVCVRITESVCCTAEINTTLQTSYAPVKNSSKGPEEGAMRDEVRDLQGVRLQSQEGVRQSQGPLTSPMGNSCSWPHGRAGGRGSD